MPGGSQSPFLQIQSGPGFGVIQSPGGGGGGIGPDGSGGGSQLPLLQIQSGPGFGVVQSGVGAGSGSPPVAKVDTAPR